MAVLLQVLAGIISVFFTGYSVFFAVVFCGYFRRKKKFPEAAPKTRFAVLIAARNEEKVIGDLVDSLLKQRYPRELYDVVVIPNNCRDHTAQRARKHGAKVLECTVPVKSKGEVLQFAFSRLMKEKKYDAFCVFDADNVVDPGYLEAMNRAFCSGARIAQGYRESKNPGRGWETASIVEDCEYSLKCVLWGEDVAWVHDAITYDEQPVSFRQSFTQRRRWSSGMLQLLPRFAPQMLRGARAGKIISRLDALLSVSAPLIQVVSCVPSLLLGAAFLLDGGKAGGTALLFCVLIPFLMNILGTTLAAGFLACIGTGYRKRLYKGILTYWLFTLSWAWISCISLFRKTSAWKEIRHTEAVGSISEVLGKQPV